MAFLLILVDDRRIWSLDPVGPKTAESGSVTVVEALLRLNCSALNKIIIFPTYKFLVIKGLDLGPRPGFRYASIRSGFSLCGSA
jgi:hypothetical protein